MINLKVFIEINGKIILAGTISSVRNKSDKNSTEATFQYSKDYLNSSTVRPISISLPIQEEPFSAKATKNFFNGLLPEGFMRENISNALHAHPDDYLAVLAFLGQECLGAIKIEDAQTENKTQSSYIPLKHEQIVSLAQEGATKSTEIVTESHLSLTGASGKVGLYFDARNNQWYQPFGDAPSTHIVKQSHIRYKKIVANEQLSILTAKKLGIKTVESFILDATQNDETRLFATKRYDRKISNLKEPISNLLPPLRLHQEDMAQALGIASVNKYETGNEKYLKRTFDLLRTYSSAPLEDQWALWDICLFNYFIGNTDNHIKNVSLLYSEDLSEVRLAPAYDIVSTLIYKRTSNNMALSIAGEQNINRIDKSSFEEEAVACGLGRKMAIEHFDQMKSSFTCALNEASEELFHAGFNEVIEIKDAILDKRSQAL